MPSRPSDSLVQLHSRSQLIPDRKPSTGEQYRFHFDMTKCVGCKCCVVACNEQNGNPGDLHWRRIGEIEGGHYPDTRRWYLSMGCNHCLEPSCLTGCPVEAYEKDPTTGVVKHNADTCIGCQYCTWNCSYGVPQYNPERGVVGKCDLCHNRLYDNDAPACVEACPQGAIAIEIIDVAAWRADHMLADAPGLPSSADSLSTTRVTLPLNMPPDIDRVDRRQLRLEHPHWPLVFMLTLTQMSVGAACGIWLLSLTNESSVLRAAALALGVAIVSLFASTLHLGRPIYAYRAIRGWRRSWLSREVLTLGLFANFAALFSAALSLHLSFAAISGALACICGLVGVYCSARVYMVPARPAWNSRYTPFEFFATALTLGPLLVRAAGIHHYYAFVLAAAAGASTQSVIQIAKLFWLEQDTEGSENRLSANLLVNRLRKPFLLRFGLLLVGGVVLPLMSDSTGILPLALLLALAGELIGRWLFFITVTPKNIASSFICEEQAA
jgi:DMSO reductase iron-sulfur subunit